MDRASHGPRRSWTAGRGPQVVDRKSWTAQVMDRAGRGPQVMDRAGRGHQVKY